MSSISCHLQNDTVVLTLPTTKLHLTDGEAQRLHERVFVELLGGMCAESGGEPVEDIIHIINEVDKMLDDNRDDERADQIQKEVDETIAADYTPGYWCHGEIVVLQNYLGCGKWIAIDYETNEIIVSQEHLTRVD